MKTKIIKILSIFINILFALTITFVYADDNTDLVVEKSDIEKTIKELKENIDNLNNKKNDLNTKIELLKNSKWELKNFFRENLNEKEVDEIKEIVGLYKIYQGRLNKKLVEKARESGETIEERKRLLETKKELYKKLIPYIKKEKLNNYVEFIRWDFEILKEKKFVSANIKRKEGLIENKVSFIKEKVKKHKKYLNQNLKSIIEKKTDEKIENLRNNDKFRILDKKTKLRIIQKTIIKVKTKIKKIENEFIKTSGIPKKTWIYELILDKLNIFKKEFM